MKNRRMIEKNATGAICECSICRNSSPFELPNDILNNLLAKKLVIFAGAGISTENRMVFPFTFYDDIAGELGINPKNGPSFPRLMSKFCARPNGRAKLLLKIHDRLSYMKAFPEVYNQASRFHRELSSIFLIENIITTNWDDLFEKECGAIPFITAEDFAFWDVPGRKVFKIHGSVNNYGSIVATSEDYEQCYKRLTTGVLGSSLKMMLATKTIVYIGYSFSDEDLILIHQILTSEMKGLRPHSYIVTLNKSFDSKLKSSGITPIYTDGTHFVSVLRAHLIGKGHMLNDDLCNGVSLLLAYLESIHIKLLEEMDFIKNPVLTYAASYQDGLIHALQRILALKNTGYYSHICNVRNAISAYEEIRKKKISQKKYWDVAYVDGYMNGLFYLIAPKELRRNIPIYYIYGLAEQPRNITEFKRSLKRSAQTHKGAYRYAQKLVKDNLGHEELVLHHTPFLL